MGEPTTTPEQRAEAPSMGLHGLWRDIANMSAVALIALMFYQTVSDQRQQMREDRAAARSFETQVVGALESVHDGQTETTKAIRALAHELRANKGDKK